MNNYRQLRVWVSADTFVRQVHPVLGDFKPAERFTIGNQLWRAALSVPCNIVEGYSRSSPKQLLYHLNVALGSLNESIYLLELAIELQLIPQSSAQHALRIGRELRAPIIAFITRIKEGRARHNRFASRRPAASAGSSDGDQSRP